MNKGVLYVILINRSRVLLLKERFGFNDERMLLLCFFV